MKKGITAIPDYDAGGRWILKITKARGKLTLEEIRSAAREHEWDHYLLHIDAVHDDESEEQFLSASAGDIAILYRSDSLYNGDL